MRWGWLLGCGALVVALNALGGAGRAASASDETGMSLRIFKQRREMVLVDNRQLVRKFTVALGRAPVGTKLVRGDNRTPEGRYYVCEKNANSRFHRFLGLSYPNRDDADRAFARRLISANEWGEIFFANLQRATPPWSTALGGRVGIHGQSGRDMSTDWTEGCIAVTDADIDYLYATVPVGTPVIISD